MQSLKFYKEVALPGSPDSNAIYAIKAGAATEVDLYISDTSGTAYPVVTDQRILNLISGAVSPEIQIVADIAARDALALTVNSFVVVQDASADATVDAGAALYVWDNANTTYSKLSEFESLDVVIDWADIQNKPASTVAAIDQAVTDSHTHANKAVLDGINTVGSGDIITAAERTQIGTNQTDIAALQTDSHTHANKTELDKIGEDGNGCMTYDGNFPMSWSTLNW